MRLCLPLRAILDPCTSVPDPISTLPAHALARSVRRAVVEERRELALWKQYAERAKAVVTSMQPSDMANIALGFARMRYRDKELLSAVARQAPLSLAAFSGEDLSRLLGSFAKLKQPNDLIFLLSAREVARKAAFLTPRQLSEILFAYTSLGYQHAYMFDSLKRRAFETAGSFQPWDLCLFLSGCAKALQQAGDTGVPSVLSDGRLVTLVTSE
eukprot:Cvel_25101.t1-p1 / transcript=Cvel_25101.t1 / gene=Cvel_25101 / organism=Chromera_velia_CCMP2878 / gene_product=hypothetical protein / transcript_product=hypothetical protein / location=Cvel_scaffold2799:23301-23936(+) / protein_length=212 / sequence_SO=supercontig / SO=protein_coding / is_pseudo=false